MFRFIIVCVVLCTFAMCKPSQKEVELQQATFVTQKIADSLRHLWAHCFADVTGDGTYDLVYIQNNSSGGYLAYREGQLDSGVWKETVIAKTPPTGGLFASGDLECGDIDGDGDMDILAVKHSGEWVNADTIAEIFWYSNPDWQPHAIGVVPDAIKDMSLADFNQDGKLDLSVLTFQEHTLSLFQQEKGDQWQRTFFLHEYNNLHEGMAIGNLNNDSFPDIAANGMAFINPGKNPEINWKVEILNEKWITQTGDWSKNGTKAFVQDLNNDGIGEIFVSHSERDGYPLVFYSKEDSSWKEYVIQDTIPACHTIQVADFNNDGFFDVLAGVNKGRAINLGKTSFPVTIFYGDGTYHRWEPKLLTDQGIYNGQVADFDNDGDVDFFQYPFHEATELFLWNNLTKTK